MNSCRFATQASVAALALALAACGGGGGGVGSTPTPGPTPTPTPTPANMSMQLTSDTTFETVGFESRATGGTNGYARGEGTKVSYLVATNTIRVELSDGRTFDFDSTKPQGYPFAEAQFLHVDELPEDFQSFSVIGMAPGGVELSYLRFGSFSKLEPITSTGVGGSTFVFGKETQTMPTTGSATYTAAVAAGGTSENVFYQFFDTSSATFTANFAAGTVSTTLHLIGAPQAGGATADFGQFAGTGTIAQAGFEGVFTGVDGRFWGGFFGPQASEMGYAFNLDDGNIAAVGFVGGRKN